MVATNIGFKATEDWMADDETQFDTDNEMELAALWWEFCKENGITTYIEQVDLDEEE